MMKLEVFVLCMLAILCVAASENPSEWQFRLSGPTSLSGRVEMRPNDTAPWGTICKDLFKENNFGAIAACNSAGLVGVTQALYKTTFGPGSGPIYLTDVACTASTTFIQNCSRSALLQTGACVHFEDVGVECSPPIQLWEFAMVNGTAPSNGVVIMRPMPNLPWGIVNNFNFLFGNWMNAREVMCRTLGFNTSKATVVDARVLGFPTDLTSVGYVSYLNVQSCASASLSHIGLCMYSQIGSSTWTGQNALAIDCNPPSPKPVGPVTVQLVNGVTASSGMIWISTPNSSASSSAVTWYGITAEDVTNFQTTSPMLSTPLTPAQKSLLRAVCASAGFLNATNPVFGKYGFAGPPTDVFGYSRLIGMSFYCSDSPGTTLSDCTVGPNLGTGLGRSPSYYAGVDCFPVVYNFSEWEFRLGGGGATATIGRVELRPNRSAPWLGVCSENDFSTKVVLWTALCRTLGFNTSYSMRSRILPTVPSFGSPRYYLGFSEAPYCPLVGGRLAPNASLQDCTLSPIGMHQCNSGTDLILDCGFPDPQKAEMRLVGSQKPGAGRLEMRPDARYDWGTVSDIWGANMNYMWEVYNAFAICWSLGFVNVTNPTLTTKYGSGGSTQMIWWSQMSCTVSDTDFTRCPSSFPFGYSQFYGHSADLGVDCYPSPFEPIVKLEGGGSPWKGRIMLQYSPYIVMGSVCNDFFKHNHFAWNAACRSAGFLNVTRAKYQSFGPAANNLPISVDDVVCSPTELFLQNCSHRPYGQHNCFHGEDAGVDCYPPAEDTSGWQFRLADGTAATNGRLEMRPGSTFAWGSVCAGPYFNHTVAAWEAACRQVGIMNPPRARWRYFPKGSDTVYLDNVSCNAGDLLLVPNCTMFPLGSYRCDPFEVAGVDCAAPAEEPSQWQFRLVGGRSNTSGRLEMRPHAAAPSWGAVCRRGLTTFEALRTVCRSVGFSAIVRPLLYRPTAATPLPPSALLFYLDGAVCSGRPPTLRNCSFAPLYSHDCSVAAGDLLYVECFPTASVVMTPSSSGTVATASQSRTPRPSRSAVVTPSLAPRRTVSRPLTPSGGWPRARTATLTVTSSRTRSHVLTATSFQPSPSPSPSHTHSRSPVPNKTRSINTSDSPTTTCSGITKQPTASRSTYRTRTATVLPSLSLPSTFGQSFSSSRTPTASPSVVATLSALQKSLTQTRAPFIDKKKNVRLRRTNTTCTSRSRTPTSTALAPTNPGTQMVPVPPTTNGTAPSPTHPLTCTVDPSALDIVQGAPLLRPLGTAYIAWPPPETSAPLYVYFDFALSAAGVSVLRSPSGSNWAIPARLVDPATLRPIGGASAVVTLVVQYAATSPLFLNATLSATNSSSAGAFLKAGGVVLVAVPTAGLLQCATAVASTTIIIGRMVLVPAALFPGGSTGGSSPWPPPPPPVRMVVPPLVSYQSAAVAEEVGALLLACERGSAAASMPSTAFFRMLSPFLAGPSHAMVLVGSAAVTGLVLALQVLTLLWMRVRGRATSLLGCAAAARAPAISIAVAEPLCFGVAYAGASLVVGAATTPLQIIAGATACACTVAFPILVVLGLRRYASRRIIAYKRVFPHPIPACLAPHIAPTTRVKPEVLVKVLAPLVSFRSLHPLLPALGSISPAATALVVLMAGAIPGLCRTSHALVALAHLLLAFAVVAVRPRRTTLLNASTAAQHLSIAAVFGWAALVLVAPTITVRCAEAILYALMVLQTAVVGCRIALTPLAFFSDRLLPYKGVRAMAVYIAPVTVAMSGTHDPLEFMPGHPDYFRDDEDRRLHNVDDDPLLSSDTDDNGSQNKGGILLLANFDGEASPTAPAANLENRHNQILLPDPERSVHPLHKTGRDLSAAKKSEAHPVLHRVHEDRGANATVIQRTLTFSDTFSDSDGDVL